MPFQRLTNSTSPGDDGSGPAENQYLGNEKRASGRLQCPYLECMAGKKLFGDVVDLSATGVRIFRRGGLKWRIGETINLTLRWHSDEIQVSARVLRTKRLGFRRHDIGLEFVEVSPETKEAIADLARGARFTLQFMTHRDVA